MRKLSRIIPLFVTLISLLGCESQTSNLPIRNILASDTSMVWVYPYESDTLYRLWSITVGNRGVIEDGQYSIYLDESETKKVYEGSVINNKQIGRQIYWRTDGSKWREYQIGQGAINSLYQSWNPDGSLDTKSEYENGVIIRCEEYFKLDSIELFIKETEYINGVPMRALVKNEHGVSIQEIYYRYNQSDSSAREYILIELDSVGFVESAWRYEYETIPKFFEGEHYEVIQVESVQLDSLTSTKRTNR